MRRHRRYRGDKVASDNQVNDNSIEDEAEELENTGESSRCRNQKSSFLTFYQVVLLSGDLRMVGVRAKRAGNLFRFQI